MARNADGRWITTPATPGQPYDDGIYRALPGVTTPAPLVITIADLPGMCGPQRGQGDAVTPLCGRLNRTYQLHSLLADIEKDRARLGRMRNAFGISNLIGHIEFAQRRLAHYLATWEIAECTHGGHAFAELTHDLEMVYPPCTC